MATQTRMETGTGNDKFPKFESGFGVETSPSNQTGTFQNGSCLKFPCNIRV